MDVAQCKMYWEDKSETAHSSGNLYLFIYQVHILYRPKGPYRIHPKMIQRNRETNFYSNGTDEYRKNKPLHVHKFY